ncbi:hypothetical protein KQX54_006663 [Cotesia glomerata]|uniref:Uncharacterized protein n=1 Tax=Cotesia glomerata TaxID=32391 RepID=A0AAV7HSS9_COTGL|nr:hypothetical protein KQX54_006663 [Cotesia glomerata]
MYLWIVVVDDVGQFDVSVQVQQDVNSTIAFKMRSGYRYTANSTYESYKSNDPFDSIYSGSTVRSGINNSALQYYDFQRNLSTKIMKTIYGIGLVVVLLAVLSLQIITTMMVTIIKT